MESYLRRQCFKIPNFLGLPYFFRSRILFTRFLPSVLVQLYHSRSMNNYFSQNITITSTKWIAVALIFDKAQCVAGPYAPLILIIPTNSSSCTYICWRDVYLLARRVHQFSLLIVLLGSDYSKKNDFRKSFPCFLHFVWIQNVQQKNERDVALLQSNRVCQSPWASFPLPFLLWSS